jgi:hypothetical protein
MIAPRDKGFFVEGDDVDDVVEGALRVGTTVGALVAAVVNTTVADGPDGAVVVRDVKAIVDVSGGGSKEVVVERGTDVMFKAAAMPGSKGSARTSSQTVELSIN